jgi:hypothetical protein
LRARANGRVLLVADLFELRCRDLYQRRSPARKAFNYSGNCAFDRSARMRPAAATMSKTGFSAPMRCAVSYGDRLSVNQHAARQAIKYLTGRIRGLRSAAMKTGRHGRVDGPSCDKRCEARSAKAIPTFVHGARDSIFENAQRIARIFQTGMVTKPGWLRGTRPCRGR